MKKTLLFSVIILSFSCTAVIPPKKIPLGAWKYRLYFNGMKAGTAAMSTSMKNNTYISTISLALRLGDMRKESHQTAIETLDGSPLYLEINNINFEGKKSFNLKTRVYFNDKKVKVVTEKNSATIQLTKKPAIEGVYFMIQLLKHNFKIGTEIKTHLFDPTIETDEVVPSSVKVIGFDRHKIKGKMKKLIHLRQKVSGVKTADIFINQEGITDLIIVRMLNNSMNLVRE